MSYMNEGMLDFSKRFKQSISCVHSNICGTKHDLLAYFEKNIVDGRNLNLPEDISLEKQIVDISRSINHDGIVAFVFDDDTLETQRINVESKQRKTK